MEPKLLHKLLSNRSVRLIFSSQLLLIFLRTFQKASEKLSKFLKETSKRVPKLQLFSCKEQAVTAQADNITKTGFID